MATVSLVWIAGWFVFGVVLGAALTFYVNLLVDRRLRVLLRRAVEDADDDWPAPPM